jgi:hypothetical protein
MPLTKLPSWIVPNDVSVEREVAPYRAMPIEDKLRLVREACQMAGRFARSHPNPSLVYEWVDPQPESTVAALRRLHPD